MIRLLRDFLLRDFWLKLFSLGLAILIWVTVSFAVRSPATPSSPVTLTTQQMTFFNVPVGILSGASDVRDFKVDPQEVTVTVQGEPRILERLGTKDIRAIIDLTGIDAAGDLRKRIEISTPSGVTHVRLVPPEVKVIFPPDRPRTEPLRPANETQ